MKTLAKMIGAFALLSVAACDMNNTSKSTIPGAETEADPEDVSTAADARPDEAPASGAEPTGYTLKPAEDAFSEIEPDLREKVQALIECDNQRLNGNLTVNREYLSDVRVRAKGGETGDC